MWVYYTIPFGFTLFWHFWAYIFNFLNYFLLLRITDEGSVPEMCIWSLSLIKSDLKWCIHLSRSLFFNFKSSDCTQQYLTVGEKKIGIGMWCLNKIFCLSKLWTWISGMADPLFRKPKLHTDSTIWSNKYGSVYVKTLQTLYCIIDYIVLLCTYGIINWYAETWFLQTNQSEIKKTEEEIQHTLIVHV